MTYWDLASFIALSLTGMFLMSFGSFFTILVCAFMDVTRKMVALPLGMGAGIVCLAIHFFWKAGGY